VRARVCVCVCVCTCVCVCACVCGCMYVCMYGRMHEGVFAGAYVCLYACTCMAMAVWWPVFQALVNPPWWRLESARTSRCTVLAHTVATSRRLPMLLHSPGARLPVLHHNRKRAEKKVLHHNRKRAEKKVLHHNRKRAEKKILAAPAQVVPEFSTDQALWSRLLTCYRALGDMEPLLALYTSRLEGMDAMDTKWVPPRSRPHSPRPQTRPRPHPHSLFGND